MKKNIIIVITLGILTGFIFSRLMYQNYEGIEYIENDGNIYYVQYGVYTSNEAALANTLKLDNYIISEMDEKFYVYLAITSNYDNALKIKNMYEEKEIHSFIRSDYVNNSELLEKLNEYDEKIILLNKEEEIQSVMKEVLTDYENFKI